MEVQGSSLLVNFIDNFIVHLTGLISNGCRPLDWQQGAGGTPQINPAAQLYV
jgi:hypothetical protein